MTRFQNYSNKYQQYFYLCLIQLPLWAKSVLVLKRGNNRDPIYLASELREVPVMLTFIVLIQSHLFMCVSLPLGDNDGKLGLLNGLCVNLYPSVFSSDDTFDRSDVQSSDIHQPVSGSIVNGSDTHEILGNIGAESIMFWQLEIAKVPVKFLRNPTALSTLSSTRLLQAPNNR